MATRHLIAACAAVLAFGSAAAPVAAARPVRHRPHPQAPLPGRSTVTVHRGMGGETTEAGPRFADAGVPWIGGDGGTGPGFWEANYGREDDAAIFAARYGCARPIWNAKSDRYVSACN